MALCGTAGRGHARADRLHGIAERYGGSRTAHVGRWRSGRPRRRPSCSLPGHAAYPHGWEAGVLYEEATGTLLCGDLFTHLGDGTLLTDKDVVGPAIAAEDMFHASSLNPAPATRSAALAELAPRTLAIMHGSSFAGDGAAALHALADDYDRRVRAALTR